MVVLILRLCSVLLKTSGEWTHRNHTKFLLQWGVTSEKKQPDGGNRITEISYKIRAIFFFFFIYPMQQAKTKCKNIIPESGCRKLLLPCLLPCLTEASMCPFLGSIVWLITFIWLHKLLKGNDMTNTDARGIQDGCRTRESHCNFDIYCINFVKLLFIIIIIITLLNHKMTPAVVTFYNRSLKDLNI